MRNRMLLLILILFLLHCTSGVVPRVNKIEVVYIGSMYEDIYRENPVSAGVAELSGVKITHTMTEPVFMEHFLYRMGLYELLKELGIDYVIGDTLIKDRDLFGIQRSMGYAITNYGGIRFAVVSSEDSLTIEDQVQLTLLKERSDIIWVIDPRARGLEPSLIDFYIRDRALSDTSMTPIRVEPDSAHSRKIVEFRDRIENNLNTKFYIGGRIDDHLFSSVAEQHGVNVIVYPEDLFLKIAEADSLTLREIMNCVAFQKKFKKAQKGRSEISDICDTEDLLYWGTITDDNIVLLPDGTTGEYIFDYYYAKE